MAVDINKLPRLKVAQASTGGKGDREMPQISNAAAKGSRPSAPKPRTKPAVASALAAPKPKARPSTATPMPPKPKVKPAALPGSSGNFGMTTGKVTGSSSTRIGVGGKTKETAYQRMMRTSREK